MLYTASFYAEDNWVGDRFRVSRGHPRGRRTRWQNLPFFYPSRELLRDYRGGELDFAGLTTLYRRGLDAGHDASAQFRQWLEEVPALGDFTLLCFEAAGV